MSEKTLKRKNYVNNLILDECFYFFHFQRNLETLFVHSRVFWNFYVIKLAIEINTKKSRV